MIRSTLWFLLLAALVVVGWPGVAAHLEWRPPVFRDATATTDEMAQLRLGLDHGTATLCALLAPIPADRAVMVVGPGTDWRLTEVHYLISSLAWPRPVWALGQVEKGQTALYSLLPRVNVLPAALALYLLSAPPQWQAHAQQVGADLTWVAMPD